MRYQRTETRSGIVFQGTRQDHDIQSEESIFAKGFSCNIGTRISGTLQSWRLWRAHKTGLDNVRLRRLTVNQC
jgi:hypothetical protein